MDYRTAKEGNFGGAQVSAYELIDELCAITAVQADIIRKLQSVIMQHGISVDDSSMAENLKETKIRMDTVACHARR